jgi:ABC-type branched-subunit amino acid transport system substrate-binding protein
VWRGDASGALVLRRTLDAGGLTATSIVVTSAARTDGLIRSGFPAVDGTVATAPCVDLSSSPRWSALRFEHDFQEWNGIAVGPCAAEAYDATVALTRSLRAASTGTQTVDRSAAAVVVAGWRSLEGIAGGRTFAPNGNLARPGVGLERAVGVRWLPA